MASSSQLTKHSNGARLQEGWIGISLLNSPAARGIPLKDRLPFDVWVAIAAYLTVQSILNLRLVRITHITLNSW